MTGAPLGDPLDAPANLPTLPRRVLQGHQDNHTM